VRPLSAPVLTTWRDVVNGIEPLEGQLIGYYNSLGYMNLAGTGLVEDVRASTLLNCMGDIVNTVAFLKILRHFAEHPDQEEAFRILTGFPDKIIVNKQLPKMGDHLKHSLVTMIQFRLDNMVRNILSTIKKASARPSYASNIDALLPLLQLSDMDRKNQILRVLQYMRNTYHNNGTHKVGKAINIQIENLTFIFDMNCPIDCASWTHVTIAMKATFEVIFEILNSGRVKALPWPVPIHI
jgi:hypothetical protein